MFGILIVEDNPIDAKMLKFYVEKKHYTCHVSTNAHEALACLEKYHIDLILLDWMLPQVNGMDLLKTIKANPRSQKIPVMIVSGRNELKDVEKAIKSGASDYVIKPVDAAILEAKMQRFLNQEVDWIPIRVANSSESFGTGAFSLRVLSVSEVGVEIETDLNIQVGSNIELALSLFESVGIPKILTKVFSSEKQSDNYRMKCSIVGLKESELQKVRLRIRELHVGGPKRVA